jgi:hypothetical protein
MIAAAPDDQFPDSFAQGDVRVANHRELAEVCSRVRSALVVQVVEGGQASQGLKHLDADELGRMEISIVGYRRDEPRRCPRCLQDGRGVDDQQWSGTVAH